MRFLGVQVLRGYCPSQTATCPALVGLLTPEQGSPGLLVASTESSRDNGLKKDWAALILLGYSGGAVPDLHRIPCLSALQKKRPTHQRTNQYPEHSRTPRGCQTGAAGVCGKISWHGAQGCGSRCRRGGCAWACSVRARKKRPPERPRPRGAKDTTLFRERLDRCASGPNSAR